VQKEFERGFQEGTLDPFDFHLAETLGCTVQELRDRLSNQEYLQWRAFYNWRESQRELAQREQMRGVR
jgi:hypothetical protein